MLYLLQLFDYLGQDYLTIILVLHFLYSVCSLEGLMLKLLWPPYVKSQFIRKAPDGGND